MEEEARQIANRFRDLSWAVVAAADEMCQRIKREILTNAGERDVTYPDHGEPRIILYLEPTEDFVQRWWITVDFQHDHNYYRDEATVRVALQYGMDRKQVGSHEFSIQETRLDELKEWIPGVIADAAKAYLEIRARANE